MSQQATIPDLQVYELPEADGSLMESDVHQGRPMRPEYGLRGDLLMAQWSLEDAR